MSQPQKSTRSRSTSVSAAQRKKQDEDGKTEDQTNDSPPLPPPKAKKGKDVDTGDSQSTLDKHFKPTTSDDNIESQLKTLTLALAKLASKDFIETKFVEMGTKLKDLENEMKTEIKKEVDKINKEVSDLKDRVKTVEDIVEDLQNKVSDMETSINSLEEEKEQLVEENEKMKEQLAEREAKIVSQSDDINNLEQYTRKNSVCIYGIDDQNPKETPTESAKKVVKMINNKLSVTISLDDIDIAHRVGKFIEDGNRPIICKFISRFKKQEVIRKRRALKGSDYVIREDLTIQNAKLLEAVSDLDSVSSTWSDGGKIIALLKTGKKVWVTRKTYLSRLGSSE